MLEWGGGVRKENSGNENQKMLEWFLRHSKIRIFKAILCTNIDKTHFNYKIVKKSFYFGGGVRKENGGKKMEIRKRLDDFWSTPKSVFC